MQALLQPIAVNCLHLGFAHAKHGSGQGSPIALVNINTSQFLLIEHKANAGIILVIGDITTTDIFFPGLVCQSPFGWPLKPRFSNCPAVIPMRIGPRPSNVSRGFGSVAPTSKIAARK